MRTWLTSAAGLVLLIGIPIVFLTGLFSYAAYNPRLGGSGNDPTPHKGLLGFYLFDWPTHPYWLYRVNQGLHVTIGLITMVLVFLLRLGPARRGSGEDVELVGWYWHFVDAVWVVVFSVVYLYGR